MQRTNTHPAPPTTAHIQRSITASTFIHVLQLELHSLFRVTQSARVNLERSMTNRFKMRTSMLMANNERTTMTTHTVFNLMTYGTRCNLLILLKNHYSRQNFWLTWDSNGKCVTQSGCRNEYNFVSNFQEKRLSRVWLSERSESVDVSV